MVGGEPIINQERNGVTVTFELKLYSLTNKVAFLSLIGCRYDVEG